MKPKSRTLRKQHKRESDRYEIGWIEFTDSDGELGLRKTVWPTDFIFYYDSNHIDFFEKESNRVNVIIKENSEKRFRFKNSADNTKFKP